jgi:hypothetical protein
VYEATRGLLFIDNPYTVHPIEARTKKIQVISDTPAISCLTQILYACGKVNNGSIMPITSIKVSSFIFRITIDYSKNPAE